MSLSILRIEQCLNLKSIQDLQSLTLLQIDSCLNLRSISNLRGLHSPLYGQTSLFVVEVISIGLTFCTSLQYLEIGHCPNLISIPDIREHFLTELIIRLWKIEVFAGGVTRLLTHLKTLMIGGFCEELDAFPSLSSTSIQHMLTSSKGYHWMGVTLCQIKFNSSLPLGQVYNWIWWNTSFAWVVGQPFFSSTAVSFEMQEPDASACSASHVTHH